MHTRRAAQASCSFAGRNSLQLYSIVHYASASCSWPELAKAAAARLVPSNTGHWAAMHGPWAACSTEKPQAITSSMFDTACSYSYGSGSRVQLMHSKPQPAQLWQRRTAPALRSRCSSIQQHVC
jgi:hypothetical protein